MVARQPERCCVAMKLLFDSFFLAAARINRASPSPTPTTPTTTTSPRVRAVFNQQRHHHTPPTLNSSSTPGLLECLHTYTYIHAHASAKMKSTSKVAQLFMRENPAGIARRHQRRAATSTDWQSTIPTPPSVRSVQHHIRSLTTPRHADAAGRLLPSRCEN